MPDDLNDYLLEEEEVFGGVLEEDASEVNIYLCNLCKMPI